MPWGPATGAVFLAAALCWLAPCRQAQAQPVPVDSTAWGPMDGFELHGNGIYWWNDGQIPDEINPARTGQIGLRSLLAGSGLVYTSSKSQLPLQSIFLRARHQAVVRTSDLMLYFAGPEFGKRLFRRAIFGDPLNEIDMTGVSFHEAGAVLLNGSTIYFCVRGGAASGAGEIRTKDIHGPPGGGDIIFRSGMGLVKKMKIITVVNEENLATHHYLFLLNTDGQLWHIRLPSLFDPTTGPLTFYTGDITDFDARTEFHSEFVPPFSFRLVYGTRLYATTGATLSDSRISGRLYSFNLTSGGTIQEHDTGHINQQLTGVAVDGERVFITQTPLLFDASRGWIHDWAAGGLYRQFAPPNRDLARSGFGLIAFGEGRNLRSDTQWLYYAHQHQILKIKTDTAALALDYRAVGIEAVQAVQDFNNTVPLVAGKPALVRGYAQWVENTTGRSRFRMTAWLRAYRNGLQLPGEVHAHNRPLIDGAADLPTLRPDLNRSFHFELPSAWLDQPGPLDLHMMVNSSGTAPETGPSPFANNIAVATVNVAPARVPCLVFKAMSSTMGDYDPAAPGSGFADIVDRAATLLPVSGFRIFFSPGSVTKPVFTFLGVKQRSFSMPGDKDWALIWMTMAHAFSRDPGGCADTHWVGMFPANIGTWNGVGGAPGVALSDYFPGISVDFSIPRTAFDNTSVVRMNAGPGNSMNPWSTVGGGNTLAHELSHNYGRFHIDQSRSPSSCGGSAPERPWHTFPGDPCTLGITDLGNPGAPIGYDPRTDTLVLPSMAADLMSYGNSRWISPFTWNALLGSVPAHVPPGGGGSPDPLGPTPGVPAIPDSGIFMVQGVLHPATGSATLLPLFQLPAGTLDPAKVQESLQTAAALPAGAPYRLRLLDAGGSLLDDRAVVPIATSDGPDGGILFVQAVPSVPGAARIQVMNGATLLQEAAASPNAPALALGTPIHLAAEETLSLEWTASDADGDTLLFTVQFSADNGASWDALRIHDPALELVSSTRLLRGGNACRIRVLATDGFHTAIALTDPFNLPQHAPSVSISGVVDSQQLDYHANAIARAFAYDAEDGSIEPGQITWTVAGPELRSGTGARFSLQGLAPGDYTLTALAPDAEGNPGSASLSLTVRPLQVPDGSAPEIDGLGDDAGYAAAAEIRLVPGQSAPVAMVLHANASLHVCFEGLPYSDPSAAPANINFYIDADGTPTTAPQPNDVGFGVDENGVTARARGTGGGWVSDAPQGFDVAILRGPSSWSAEFRIPDAAIGGWNHRAAMAILLGVSPGTPRTWPPSSDVFNPSTWAALSLGPLPALDNRPPVAVASAPDVVSYTDPVTVALDGSGSYDLDGNPLAFTWTQTGGPAVTLIGATSAEASFLAPALGSPATVTLQLQVHDGLLNSSPAAVSIHLAPVTTSPSGIDPEPPVTVNVGDGSAAIQLVWPGAPGDYAAIHASMDLVDWEAVATNSASYLGVLLHNDLQAGLHPRRFYRAVSWEPPPAPARAELSFDGVDDVVEVAHHASLNAFPLTVAFWLKTADLGSTARGLVSKYADDGNGYALILSEGRLGAWYFRDLSNYLWNGNFALNGGFVADNQWHHVVLVVDADGGRLYVDGSLKSSLAWVGTGGAATTTRPLQFGRYFNYPVALNGLLDEIALWNRALTEEEINQMIPGKLTGAEPGLIGFWPLDEGAGPLAGDASGRGQTGTLQNGPLWFESSAPLRSNPAAGTALRFDGVNDVFRVAHHPELNAFPLTVAGWVKTSKVSPDYVALANKYAPGSGNGYSLHIYNGRVAAFYFRGDGASYVYAGDPGLDGGFVADGRWHHVAFVVDAAGGRLYLDGAPTASLGWAGTPGGCSTTVPIQSGLYPDFAAFDGRVDELTLWNRALDATEINAVMNFKPKGTEPGLTAFWPFDEGAGGAAADTTGHGHHGTLLNGTLWVPSDAPVYP